MISLLNHLTFHLLLYLLPLLAACFILHSLATFTIHLHQARTSGLPYMIMPYSENNFLNNLISSTERFSRVTRRYLPRSMAEKVLFNALSSRWMLRDRMFRKLGRIFLIVSPGSLTCHVADAAVASHIYRSRQQFGKAAEVYSKLHPS